MVSSRTIIILGGYGGAGLPIARLLLQETDVGLILAGRHQEKAAETAAQLNAEFQGGRVRGAQVDASMTDSLKLAFADADMVLVCATTVKYVREVAQAALAAGIDYMDIHYPQGKVPVLQALAPAIKEAGRCFITEAGFHPGLPSAFVRYAAPSFSHLRTAIIGMAMKAQHLGSSGSLPELIEDFSDYQAYVFKDGQWRKSGSRDTRKMDFGPGFGVRSCYPMQMEEMRALPQLLGLEETGVYVAGFNWFIDYLVFPLAMGLGKIRKGLGTGLLVRLMEWGANAFTRPPLGIVFKLEAEGDKDGQPRRMEVVAFHEDGYQFTAIPAVACLLQYLDGSIARPGLWMMGQVTDPVRLLNDMERMGIRVEISINDAGRGG